MNDQSEQNLSKIEYLRSQLAELERKNQELTKQIRVNEALFHNVLDALPINIFLEDPEGHTIYANKQACESNGLKREDLIGKTVFDFFPPSIAKLNREYDLEVWKQRKLITKEILAGFKGNEHHMFTGKSIIHNHEADEDFLIGFGLDITDRVKAEELLRESEEKFRTVIEQAVDSFFLIDIDGMISDVNPTSCEVLSYEKDELLSMNINMIFSCLPEKLHDLHPDSKDSSSANFEDILIDKNNNRIPVDINIRQIHVGKTLKYFALCRDIRDKKRVEEQIRHMAYHDALTGLPNRWYIQSYFQQYLSYKDSIPASLGLILLDLDYFKVINDTLGHDVGDLLLKEVSKRLRHATEHPETVLARFGGDEFIVLIPHISDQAEMLLICEKILAQMVETFTINGHQCNISASMGISFYPKDGEDLHTLIKNADLAMYGSKDQGRSCISLFHPTMQKHEIKRAEINTLI